MAGKKDRIERINSQAVPLPEAFIDWMDRRMPRLLFMKQGKRLESVLAVERYQVIKNCESVIHTRARSARSGRRQKPKRRL